MTDRGGKDRRVLGTADLERISFDEKGLVPVVAQNADTGEVLMVAYADKEALAKTLETGEMHFWSRTRARLWRKGATSGNVQAAVGLFTDCDDDTVLARVRPAGPACHTGERTCFGEVGAGERITPAGETELDRLWATLQARPVERPAGSYTTRLLDDDNLRLKKLGEETTELVMALGAGDERRTTEEAADLVYHLLVALLGAGVTLDGVRRELARRAAHESA